MRIALAQINPTIGDFEHNTEKMMGFIEKARGLYCDLIVFSELVISGCPPRDLLERRDFVAANLRHLNGLVASVAGIGVICGVVDEGPDQGDYRVCNSAVLFDTGKILHRAHKRLLPDHDVFDERRDFEPGGESSPFLYKGRNIGLTICDDIWNDAMIEKGADLIICISASPYYTGKRRSKRDMLGKLAGRYGVPLLYVNQVGGNDSLVFDGTSMAFDSTGRISARARDFEEDMVFFDTDTQKGELHAVSGTEMESVLKALVTGTRDYARKCGFDRAVVGLSGGIDSAVTASIAVYALGNENVTGLFMPSQYTSQDNFEDTKSMAENLGIELIHVPIAGIFERFLQELSPLFEDEDVATQVTGQNLQARIRGTLLMALSNKFGSLPLSTGNKSELGVGYCTLYGDMSGGLAVISDVPKTMVYELARLTQY